MLQYLIVFLIVGAAVAFAVRSVNRQRRSFSAKGGCEANCGCSGSSKKEVI